MKLSHKIKSIIIDLTKESGKEETLLKIKVIKFLIIINYIRP